MANVTDASGEGGLSVAEVEARASALVAKLVNTKEAIGSATSLEVDQVLIRAMQQITNWSSSGNLNEESRATREAIRCELDRRHVRVLKETLRDLSREAGALHRTLATENGKLMTRLGIYSGALALLAIAVAVAAWRKPVTVATGGRLEIATGAAASFTGDRVARSDDAGKPATRDPADLVAYVDAQRQAGMSESAAGELGMVAYVVAGATLLTYREGEDGTFERGYMSASCPKPGMTPEELQKSREATEAQVAPVLARAKALADNDHSGFVSADEAELFRSQFEFARLVAHAVEVKGDHVDKVARAIGRTADALEVSLAEYAAYRRGLGAEASDLLPPLPTLSPATGR